MKTIPTRKTPMTRTAPAKRTMQNAVIKKHPVKMGNQATNMGGQTAASMQVGGMAGNGAMQTGPSCIPGQGMC